MGTKRRGLLRTAGLLAALLVLPVLVASTVGVHAQGPLAFGIRPATTTADDPTKGAYFSYTLQAGATVEDEAVVQNDGEEPITLKMYAADGLTAINGSTAFTGDGETHRGVQSWLSAGISEAELSPGESINVPFSVRVPPGTPAGDHVAGWVVEAPPKSGSGSGVGATVLERVGVAVVVHVPGATREEIVLGAVCLNQETGSNYFEIGVRNQGNVMTKGQGVFTLSEEDAGEQVFSVPIELGTVLPQDDTFLRVDGPFDPGRGDYVAAVSLRQTNGVQLQTATPIEIGDVKVNGCASVAGAEGGAAAADQRRNRSDSSDGGLPWLTISLVTLVLLLVTLLVARELRERRRRNAGPAD